MIAANPPAAGEATSDSIAWAQLHLIFLPLAPHVAVERHLHLAAAYARGTWVEHFKRLEPMFNVRLRIADDRIRVPDRPELGFSLSVQAPRCTRQTVAFGKRP